MSDYQDDTTPLEYFISGLVILFFGLLYFLFNHGLNLWPDSGAGERLASIPAAVDPAPVHRMAAVTPVAMKNTGGKPVETAVADAEKRIVATERQLAAAQQQQAKAAEREQADKVQLLAAAAEQEKLEEERQAEAKSMREQLETERLKAQEAMRQLEAVKNQLAEEMARNKAERELAAAAIKQAVVKPETITQPLVTQKPTKRLAFNLPDGAEVVVPDTGFAGAVKTAMIRRTLNTPMQFDAIRFESGSARLSDGSQEQIKAVAALLNTYKDIKILIRGHTDNVGGLNANSLLSLTRSSNMKKQLIGLGIDRSRIKIEGVGQLEPLASNDTDEGRNANRRIELVLIE
ncbi:MAG: OmpA family protein [Thiolinea sp.]